MRTSLWLSLLVLVLVGCQDSRTDQSSASGAKSKLISASPVENVGSISQAVESLKTPENPDVMSDRVAVRGRIDAGDLNPFEPDRAAFLVSEIIVDPNGGEGHDASSCPFCKRRAEKAPKAHVILVDEAGQPLKSPADKLLSLNKGDIVQVAGKATFDESLNTLTVRATGVHLE
jgi:hypothetical protein